MMLVAKTALGVEIARNVADRPYDLQPALRNRNLLHRLVFGPRDIDREGTANGGKRDDCGSQQGTDFDEFCADYDG
jgi:hypothetical protein